MTQTKKTGIKFFKYGRGKKSTTRGRRYLNKKSKKSTKRIKLIIKNLGKRNRTNKRMKKMRGGGPGFQPFTDTSRSLFDSVNGVYDIATGNIPSTN